MSFSKVLFVAALLLFSLPGLSQEGEAIAPAPSGLQVGAQLGMGHFLPFKTGGARQGGRNEISQFYSEGHESTPGLRMSAFLLRELKGVVSFVQELGALQSSNAYTVSFQGLSDVNNYTSGNGSAEIKSTFLQSFTGLQFGSRGALKFGVQIGLEINVRLAEAVMGTIETDDPDVQTQGGFEIFPIIVEDMLSREAFLGAAGTVYAGYDFGKHEIRVQARGSSSRLSTQKGALASQAFPRVSSLSLAWLFRLR